MGWVGSLGLAECMSDAPCGCDLLESAKTDPDARAKAVKRTHGLAAQKVWNCPRRPGAAPAPIGVTDGAALLALDNVRDLTFAEGLQTCPLWYTRLEWLGDVLKLRRWFAKGQLALKVPHPSGALCDAIDCIEDSVALRESHDLESIQKPEPQKYPGKPPPVGPPKR